MAENQNFKCSGDCLKCHANQRAYCASQFTYNSMRMIEKMQETLVSMQGTIEVLGTRIEAIQNNEASIFDPTKEDNLEKPNLPIAQEGDGAEE